MIPDAVVDEHRESLLRRNVLHHGLERLDRLVADELIGVGRLRQ